MTRTRPTRRPHTLAGRRDAEQDAVRNRDISPCYLTVRYACRPGCTPDSAAHIKPEHPASGPSAVVRGKPTVRTDRPNGAYRPS